MACRINNKEILDIYQETIGTSEDLLKNLLGNIWGHLFL